MAPHLAFDEATGQVYTETTVSVGSMVPTWMQSTRGQKENPSTHRHVGRGTCSLYDTALRSCAWNIGDFSPETLVGAEWYYAERIHRHLKKKDLLSLRIWALFQVAFPDSTDLGHSYHTAIAAKAGSVPHELDSIRTQLMSLPASSLTYLDLRNLSLRDVHLMELLNLPSIGVLALEQSPAHMLGMVDDSINDGFIRRWGRAVSEQRAFTKLKVIVFRLFSTSLASTLESFAAFPGLKLCNLNSRFSKQDTKGMLRGQLVPRDKDKPSQWRHHRTDGDNLHSRNNNPQATWTRPDKTIHERMAMLHSLADTLLPSTKAQPSSRAIVSIDYGGNYGASHGSLYGGNHGGTMHYNDPKSSSAWFVRVPLPAEELAGMSMKRPGEGGGEGAGQGGAKKRLVRKGRQQDVGSLLGAFG